MTEPLYQLVYTSQTKIKCDPDTLAAIAQEASTKNEQLGVTGVLLYGGGWFIQLLEGDNKTIQDLAKRIKCDPRHLNYRTVHHQPASSRLFPNWSMGHLCLHPMAPDASNPSGIGDESTSTDPTRADKKATPIEYLRSFIRRLGDDFDLATFEAWSAGGQSHAA